MALLDGFFGGKKSEADYDYELEFKQGDYGQGFVVRRASDGQLLQWQSLPKSEGLESVEVAGVSFYRDALQDSSFDPGQPLELVRAPDNPHDPNAFAIWNAERTLQVGHLPAYLAAKLAKKWGSGPGLGVLSMWETRKGKKRVALRVLLMHDFAKIRGIKFQ